ncbi:defensin-like [Nylanderia fulva]|uniref:defensin-like n=1 Tax=Nylanderia fulva TaxID=613905 RepID=UPI0010FB4E53|nr:defensin-like [Nylanderia fulva]
MKIFVFVLLIMTTVAIALPMEDLLEMENKSESLELQLASTEENHVEPEGFLCEIFADGFNDTACAISCILTGRTGGKCTKDGVCLCRKKKWIG